MDTLKMLLEEYGWFIGVPVVFILIALWIFRPGAKKGYEEDGKLPFDESERNK